jgi:hypothetical protein
MMARRVHSASHSSILCDVSTILRPARAVALMRSQRKRRAPAALRQSTPSERTRVHAGGGLIEEDDGRVADQGNGCAELALVAAAAWVSTAAACDAYLYVTVFLSICFSSISDSIRSF